MTTLLCQEHYDMWLKNTPRAVRLATRALGKIIKDTAGIVLFEIVPKESCSVCLGLFLREHERINMCPEHLKPFYMAQPESRLKDPAFTLQFSSWPKEKCVVCENKGVYPPELAALMTE